MAFAISSLYELPDVDVRSLGLSSRTEGCLMMNLVINLQKLAELTPSKLMGVDGIGEKSFMEIVTVLKKYGTNDLPYTVYMKSRHKNPEQ